MATTGDGLRLMLVEATDQDEVPRVTGLDARDVEGDSWSFAAPPVLGSVPGRGG